MTLDERAPTRVLASEAHRGALHEQRPEGQELSEAPVDPALAGHQLALVQELLELGVDREACRWPDVRAPDPAQHLSVDRRLPADHRAGVLELGLRALEAGDGFAGRRGRGRALATLGEDPLELVLVVLQHLGGLVDGDVPAADQRLGVELAGGPLALDEVVHEGLRHRRVVALVVAPAAVADHVDDHVAVELLAELERELGHADARLRVVPVDVEDRDLQALRDVRAVVRRP